MSVTSSRVLVVDDEANIRMMLRTALEAERLVVDESAYGETVLEQCRRQRYDLVLLDLRLPGIDGLQVLRGLRAAACTVPVVMLTAHGTIDAAVEAMKLGAADFLQKPFTPETLRRVVARVLADAAASSSRGYDELIDDALREADAVHLDAAESAASRALSIDPTRPEAWNFLGGIAELRGDRRRALAFYRTTLELDSRYEPAERNLERATSPSSAGPVHLTRDPASPRRGPAPPR